MCYFYDQLKPNSKLLFNVLRTALGAYQYEVSLLGAIKLKNQTLRRTSADFYEYLKSHNINLIDNLPPIWSQLVV